RFSVIRDMLLRVRDLSPQPTTLLALYHRQGAERKTPLQWCDGGAPCLGDSSAYAPPDWADGPLPGHLYGREPMRTVRLTIERIETQGVDVAFAPSGQVGRQA